MMNLYNFTDQPVYPQMPPAPFCSPVFTAAAANAVALTRADRAATPYSSPGVCCSSEPALPVVNFSTRTPKNSSAPSPNCNVLSPSCSALHNRRTQHRAQQRRLPPVAAEEACCPDLTSVCHTPPYSDCSEEELSSPLLQSPQTDAEKREYKKMLKILHKINRASRSRSSDSDSSSDLDEERVALETVETILSLERECLVKFGISGLGLR